MTVFRGIQAKAGKRNVAYSKGCSIRDILDTNIEEAVKVAMKADVVIAVVGGSSARDFKTEYIDTGAAVASAHTISDMESGEGFDRSTLHLLGNQLELLKALKETGKPLVVVYIQGRPLNMNWASEHADALLTAWYPGQEGGAAVADVLYGDYNPSGRLPISVARSVGQLPVHYNKRNPVGHNYVEVSSDPLYVFGYGKSYTEFEYKDVTVDKTSGTTYEVSLTVTNTGGCAGSDVVQLYIKNHYASVSQPNKQLRHFKKIHLEKGESEKVMFTLTEDDFSIIDVNMRKVMEPDGVFSVLIGKSADNIIAEELISLKAPSSKLIVISESDLNELRYWPINGEQLPFYTLSTQLSIEPGSPTEINFTDKGNIYSILAGKRNFKIYTSPGSIDTLYIKKDSLLFTGCNKPYNDYFIESTKFDQYVNDFSRTRNHELEQIDLLTDYNEIISKRKAEEYSLMSGKSFKKEFIDKQRLFIDVKYNMLFLKKVSTIFGTSKLSDEWKEALIATDFLFTNELSRRSEFYYDQLKDYVCIQNFLFKDIKPQDVMATFNTFLFNNYCEMLSGRNLEFSLAHLIYYDIFQENYSQDIPSLHKRFTTLFPDSKYMETVIPGVRKTEEIYSQNKQNEKIILLDYDSEPANFQEILKPFRDKIIYLDVWATNCAPCHRMFPYMDNLKEKLSEHKDIVFFYISLDRDTDHEKWLNMVYYYNLEGYHYRVNQIKIIFQALGNSNGMLMIPRYVILDKEGNIAFHNAAEPNDVDKVVEQIKTLINQ